MSGGRHDETLAQATVRAGAVSQPLGQMHPVGADGDGQGHIRPDEEPNASAPGKSGQAPGLRQGVDGAKGPKDDGGAGRQPRQHLVWKRRTDRIGKEEQRRQRLTRVSNRKPVPTLRNAL